MNLHVAVSNPFLLIDECLLSKEAFAALGPIAERPFSQACPLVGAIDSGVVSRHERREKMGRKLVGGAVAAAGVALLVLSAFADPIGIGADGGFGWKQTTGVVIATAAVVVGFALYVREEQAWL